MNQKKPILLTPLGILFFLFGFFIFLFIIFFFSTNLFEKNDGNFSFFKMLVIFFFPCIFSIYLMVGGFGIAYRKKWGPNFIKSLLFILILMDILGILASVVEVFFHSVIDYRGFHILSGKYTIESYVGLILMISIWYYLNSPHVKAQFQATTLFETPAIS